MADIEALEETFAYIKAHPDQLDLNAWGRKTECGTTACFAGHHLLLTGQAEFRLTSYTFFKGLELVPTGKYENIPPFIAAQKSLGLTYIQARALFLWTNDLQDIRRTIDNIKNGAWEWEKEYLW